MKRTSQKILRGIWTGVKLAVNTTLILFGTPLVLFLVIVSWGLADGFRKM